MNSIDNSIDRYRSQVSELRIPYLSPTYSTSSPTVMKRASSLTSLANRSRNMGDTFTSTIDTSKYLRKAHDIIPSASESNFYVDDSLAQQVETLRQRLDSINHRHRREIENMQEDYEDKLYEIERLREVQTERLNEDMRYTSTRLEHQKLEAFDLEKELINLQYTQTHEIGRLEESIKDINRETRERNDEVRYQREVNVRGIKSEIASLEDKYAKTIDLVDRDYSLQIEELNRRREQRANTISTLRLEIEELKRKLTIQQEDVRTHIGSIQREVEEFRSKAQAHKRQYDIVKSETEEAEDHHKKLHEESQRLMSSLSKSKQRNVQIKGKFSKLKTLVYGKPGKKKV